MRGKKYGYIQTAAVARAAAGEGAVLLKNEKKVLPVKKNETVSVFGRTQFDYIKSGTGSGGLVNVEYATNITDSLGQRVNINRELADIYRGWITENPVDMGDGWAKPWFQKEMPISNELVRNAVARSDKAIVVIGRTAGESKDNSAAEGSYFLTEDEYGLIKSVSSHFEKVCILLNVGNVIDTTWAEELEIPAVMYIWQGGMEGGNAVADIICGDVSPSGKLTDTVMRDISAYPPAKNFGNADMNMYEEDIYVGYRYFETFAKNEVLYPFGFGLSYTSFSLKITDFCPQKNKARVNVRVNNSGSYAGKEIVQAYMNPPMGADGRPQRELAAFAKTMLLQPGETQDITLEISTECFKRYCDCGEYRFCYIIEEGEYGIYVGTDVRSAELAGSCCVAETVIIERLQQAMPPVRKLRRMRPVFDGDNIVVGYEEAPQKEYDLHDRVMKGRPTVLQTTEDAGVKLRDVSQGKCTMDKFIAQLCEDDLMCIVRGEGMNSPKVTPGTASAFGGVTRRIFEFGIPVACCADGPSGIRMDNGAKAASIPNGTCLACSWNTDIVEKLYEAVGRELIENNIDTLLGPGINIHRTPLCGRNFEYFSEDPYLTGKMAAAATRGLNKYGAFGTIKHFVCNEQEYKRSEVDACVSERALREIYLKPFEMAVKEGKTQLIMTSYNPINGIRAAGNYDLNTTILRGEWGYDGLVMTDWWAMMNNEGEEGSKDKLAEMAVAQNDIYMVCDNAENHKDNLKDALADGTLTIGELQRNAKNICRVMMQLPVYRNKSGNCVYGEDATGALVFTGEDIALGDKLDIRLSAGRYRIEIEYCLAEDELLQSIVKLLADKTEVILLIKGTGNEIGAIAQNFELMTEIDGITIQAENHNLRIKTLSIYAVIK